MRDSKSITTTISELVAGDANRSELIIQPRDGDICIFPYDTTGTAAQGIEVLSGTQIFLRGPAAKLPIKAVTASGTVVTVVFGI